MWSPSPQVAVDARTHLPVADYSWLSHDFHSTFQPMLELEDGIALLHFVCEVRTIDVQESSAGSNAVRRRSTFGDNSRAPPVEVTAVLLLSLDAMFFCGPRGNIVSYIPVDAVESMLICDHWICLCIPAWPRDIVFSLVPSGWARKPSSASSRELPHTQSDFVSILNCVRAFKDAPKLLPVVVDSHYTIVSRLQHPPRPSQVQRWGAEAPPIPFLSFEEIREEVIRPNILIDVMSFAHRLRCPRLETWELEKRNRTRTTEALRHSAVPSVASQARLVVKKHSASEVSSAPNSKGGTPRSRAVSKAASPLRSNDGSGGLHQRTQRLANILDGDDDGDAPRLSSSPTFVAKEKGTYEVDSESDGNTRLLNSIRAHSRLATRRRHAAAETAEQAAPPHQHVDPQGDLPTTVVEMALSSSEGTPVGSPSPPSPPITTPRDRNNIPMGVHRSVQQARPSHAEAGRAAVRTPRRGGFMSPTSSVVARREAAEAQRRQNQEAKAAQQREAQQQGRRIPAAARPRATPSSLGARKQLTPVAASSGVKGVQPNCVASSLRVVKSPSPPPLEHSPHQHNHTIGKDGLMIVWEELKSQKQTLDMLTKHVEALVLDACTSADGPSSTGDGTRRSTSPQQRRGDQVDKRLHNVANRLDALSTFQKSLLLRPLPSEHPHISSEQKPPAKSHAPVRSSGKPSVQTLVDTMVLAAAPERKQLSAPPRPKGRREAYIR